MAELQTTVAPQLGLEVLLADSTRTADGLEIGRSAGAASRAVEPVFARVEVAGWLESRGEDVDPRETGRPPRRDHSQTWAGAVAARATLGRGRRPVWHRAPRSWSTP